jgi:hypothetical protein
VLDCRYLNRSPPREDFGLLAVRYDHRTRLYVLPGDKSSGRPVVIDRALALTLHDGFHSVTVMSSEAGEHE